MWYKILDAYFVHHPFSYIVTFDNVSGINIFLDGFVPTENLRFRESSLVFKISETATDEEVKRLCRYDYPLMVKELGKFLIFFLNFFKIPIQTTN
jgi:translation initiation factor RLI1